MFKVMLNLLMAWFIRLSPTTRLIVAAAVPALLVFAVEEVMKPAPRPALEAEEQGESAPGHLHLAITAAPEVVSKHIFTKEDSDSVTNLATQSDKMLQALDQNMNQPHASNEAICLNELRYGAYGYVTTILQRLQQNLIVSVHMQKAEDEAYLNNTINYSVDSTLTLLPAMDMTIGVMTKGCVGNANVASWGSQIKGFLSQVSPVLHTLQDRARARQQQKH